MFSAHHITTVLQKGGFCGLKEMAVDHLGFLKDSDPCRNTGATVLFQSWFYGFTLTIPTLLFNFLQLKRDLNTQTIS